MEDKAPGRVEKIRPAFTSQRCSACGQVDPKSRESQAVFRCTACGFACHADVNAAMNIARGTDPPPHPPIAGRRRGYPACEPRTTPAAPIGVVAGIPRPQAGEDVKLIALVVAVVGSLGAPLITSVTVLYRVSLSSAQWTLTSTLLAGAIATPVLGRLGSGWRRREVILWRSASL